jgi:hypothetical protein
MPPPPAPDAAAQLQRELSAGERLLWAGRPRSGLVLRPGDAFLVPFSLLWGGFACYWEYSVVTGGAPWFFMLWGVPFVLMGLYLIVGRLFVDARMRANTVYGLTGERVIILSGLFARTVKSLNLRTLSDVSLTERADGSGSISFGPGSPYGGWFQPFGPWPGRGVLPPTFDLIPRAKEVYEAIRTAQRGDGLSAPR